MPCGGEDDEQQAAEKADSDRNNVQNLLSLDWRRRGIKAAQHVFVPQSHGRKHKHRQNRMNPVDEPQLVLAQIRERSRAVVRAHVVEQPEAFGGGEAVVDSAVGGLDAVGEGSEEAREAEEDEKDGGERAGGGVAGAVGGEDGSEELKGQEGACWEEVGQVGCRCEGLRYGTL